MPAIEAKSMTVAHFLEHTPPGHATILSDLLPRSPDEPFKYSFPVIELACDDCKGRRNFGPSESIFEIHNGDSQWRYIHYSCRNCGKGRRSYAVTISRGKPDWS